MLERILPPVVRFSEARTDRGHAQLFPEEKAVIQGAVPQRRHEFATVRRCARDALMQLGCPPVPLLPGEGGAPLWPLGVVGSMTHCEGYRAAAVAASSEVILIGIDAETNAPLPDDLVSSVCMVEERRMIRRLPDNGIAWDRLLFSAKEATFKAWFPSTRHFLDFADIEVTLDPGGTFVAHLLIENPAPAKHQLASIAGQWTIGRGIIGTAVVVTRGQVPRADFERRGVTTVIELCERALAT